MAYFLRAIASLYSENMFSNTYVYLIISLNYFKILSLRSFFLRCSIWNEWPLVFFVPLPPVTLYLTSVIFFFFGNKYYQFFKYLLLNLLLNNWFFIHAFKKNKIHNQWITNKKYIWLIFSAYVPVSKVTEYLSSESDLELEQSKSPTKTEALHCLQMIINYLTSISETTDIDYNSLYNIGKRTVGNTSRDKQTLMHQYFMSHNKKLSHQRSDFYFFYFCVYFG